MSESSNVPYNSEEIAAVGEIVKAIQDSDLGYHLVPNIGNDIDSHAIKVFERGHKFIGTIDIKASGAETGDSDLNIDITPVGENLRETASSLSNLVQKATGLMPLVNRIEEPSGPSM